MFKAFYNSICYIGSLTVKIILLPLRLLTKTVFQKLGRLLKRLFVFLGKGFHSPKLFVKRTVAFLLVAALITSAVLFSPKQARASAVEVIMDGATVGYAESEDEAKLAEAIALKKTGKTDSLELSYIKTKTAPFRILSANALSDILIEKSSPEFIKVCDIYIDSKYLCSVKSQGTADEVFSQILAQAEKKHSDSAVSFTQSISYGYSYKKSGDDSIWSGDKLKLSVNTLSLLTPQHVKSENSLNTVEYDTVEIESSSLFIGDSRERRPGQNGSEYVIDLVTYIENEKVMSAHLMSLSVKEPVSRVVEKGNRAESLSMGSYTVVQTAGVFCWPVVGLNTVTSPFGERSLGYHHGLDISGANASGSLVVAGASGTVTEAGWSNGGYGNYVIISHGNGVETLYGHMLDNSLLVSAGDTVTKGQGIGRVGDTGYSFGAHLHFEVRINGNRINPAPYLGLS